MTQDAKEVRTVEDRKAAIKQLLATRDTSNGNVPEKVAKAVTLVVDWLIDGPDKEAHSTSNIIEAGETVKDWIHPL